MAELMSAVLFEKKERALVVRRRRAPFSGQWMLPLTRVRDDEAAEEALRRGLSYRVLEQGSLSDTVRKYPRRKILLAEPVRVPLYGDLWIADASNHGGTGRARRSTVKAGSSPISALP